MRADREIPKLIHQTWRDENIPAIFEPFAKTWREHHPDWEYRLWTDADNRALVASDYAWFLPAYDAYAEPIMRADAARYFILHRFGGIYADLDFECLRPFDSLLAREEVVVGLEPEPHIALHFPRERGLDLILCNAFMASAPAHPFFEHLFRLLTAFADDPGPLDATGPFLLTRAYLAYADRSRIKLLAPDVIYPVTGQESEVGMLGNPGDRSKLLGAAFAVHHWAGTWWRKPETKREHQPESAPVTHTRIGGRFVIEPRPIMENEMKLPVRILDRGRLLAIAELEPDRARALIRAEEKPPLVSALMVTRGRARLAARAIHCFCAQTYPSAELVIIDDDVDDALDRHVLELADPRVRHFRIPSENRSLGELRNLALTHATGDYVCQWDDDDLSDPERIELQVAAALAFGAAACFLQRERILSAERHVLAHSGRRLWEGSFLCERESIPKYPEQRRGEDTPVAVSIMRANRVVLLDRPDLYTYVFHGQNTFDSEHFDALLAAATEIIDGPAFEQAGEELASRLNITRADLGLLDPAATTKEEHLASRSAPVDKTTDFSVLILCPVKDAARFVPRFIENLRTLTYDHRRISIAFLESDSSDGTASAIEKQLPDLAREFRRAELYRRDFGFRTDLPRWEPAIQRVRRATLARSRNYLLSCALREESWALWMDVDVATIPPDLIEQLLAPGKDIVVPHCVTSPGGATFDLNTFSLEPSAAARDWTPFVVDGILQPPRGEGRLYLESLRDRDLVEVDGVGGTVLLVRADLHREGLIFPTTPYKLHIETEGLAYLARDMGYPCYALPQLEVVHPPSD